MTFDRIREIECRTLHLRGMENNVPEGFEDEKKGEGIVLSTLATSFSSISNAQT